MDNSIDNNKLIAEFMGLEITGPGFSSGYSYKEEYVHFEDVLYHKSWNWLMPVVEKIENLGYGVTIFRKGCHIDAGVYISNEYNNAPKITQTYKAVIEFIKWYNDIS